MTLSLGGALLGGTLGVGGFARAADEVVRAERVELVNKAGVRQAVLSSDTLGLVVTLLDERGRPTASLRLSGEPWLSVQTASGREVAGLGAPRVHRLTE
jgi:hypothetical protein